MRVLHVRVRVQRRGRAANGLLRGRLEAVVWVLPGMC